MMLADAITIDYDRDKDIISNNKKTINADDPANIELIKQELYG